MDNEKLRKGLEGVMSKAGWTEDDIIDFVRDNLKSLVEIDGEKIVNRILPYKIYKPFYHPVEKTIVFCEMTGKERGEIVKGFAKANPIKLKEE